MLTQPLTKFSGARVCVAPLSASLLLAASAQARPAESLREDCFGLTATILGTEFDDNIVGTAGPDVIRGLNGTTSSAAWAEMTSYAAVWATIGSAAATAPARAAI